MEEALIQYKNVEIHQQELCVLSGVNLELHKGEFVYLIGKVGSGKTSLLKTLYGELDVIDGDAEVLGYNMRSIKRKHIPQLRRKLGIVFQDFQLLTDRTVYNNLEFVLRATGWKNKQEIKERIEEVLDLVGMSNKGYKIPNELSGGEQQRIVIARAVLNSPAIILADERFYDTERLTATWSSNHPCSSETVAYRHPSLAKFTFVIVPHRYIHAILVLILLFALLETFILEVKPVFTQSLLDELRDVIQCDMHQYHTDQRSRHIEDDVQRQGVEPRFHRMMVQPHGEHNQEQSADKWI